MNRNAKYQNALIGLNLLLLGCSAQPMGPQLAPAPPAIPSPAQSPGTPASATPVALPQPSVPQPSVQPTAPSHTPKPAITPEPLLPPWEAPPSQTYGTLAYLDERYGFQRWRFEDAPTDDLELMRDDGRIKTYSPGGRVQIGEVAVPATLTFADDKFAEVKLEANSLTAGLALRDAFQSAYGPGNQSNRYLYTYTWLGNRVWLYLDIKPVSYRVVVFMRSLPMEALLKEIESSRASEAGRGL